MYKVEYLESLKNDLQGLQKSMKEKLRKAIEKKLMLNPVEFGKPLQYSLKGLRRLRVEEYRIIYQIDPNSETILIVKIGHRKEVYEEKNLKKINSDNGLTTRPVSI